VVVRREKLVAEAADISETRRRGTSADENLNQATTSEDLEDVMIFGVCNSARLLQFLYSNPLPGNG
jgi:hypothetical protein